MRYTERNKERKIYKDLREREGKNLVMSNVLSKTGKNWEVLKVVAVMKPVVINVIVAAKDLNLKDDKPHTP